MSAATIARALGAAQRSGRWWRCICPVHGSRTGRSSTLSLRDGDRGLVVHCHALCDPRDVLAELRCRRLIDGRGGDTSSVPEPSARAHDRHEYERRIAISGRIWREASEARGSPVAAYLAARGIICSPLPPTLRWAPSLRHPDGSRGPAMVARIDNIDGELIGISRTWLDRDAAGVWHRRHRAMLGCAAGGAVRLAPMAETLLIGEGIETTLATMQATGLPGWAALSTSGLKALVLPPIVRTVVILADHDENGAGERAARLAADRWLAEGRRVRIAMPPEPGTDFNDVMLGRAHARITEARDVAA